MTLIVAKQQKAAMSSYKTDRPTFAVIAASVGNMLEWYDFAVYALFATYIAKSFFPNSDPAVALLKTFLTFGVGFVIRPVGAIVIGAYGDWAGRKAALTLTIMMMAIGTLMLAVSPTYATIGLWAPALLLTGRLLQGLSAGGEVGSASAFLVENASSSNRGALASWLQASMGMSNILGALVAFTVTATLSSAQVQAWGWRIPFLLGLLIAPVGLVMLRFLKETPDFEAELARRRVQSDSTRVPVLTGLRGNWGTLGIGFGLSILWAVAVYVLIIFTPVYVQGAFGFTPRQAFAASLIGNVLFVAACFAAGRLSDRVGRSAVLAASALALLALTLPLYLWLQASPSLSVLILVQSAFCVMVATFVGVAPAALGELFPVGIRSMGISLVYNGAFTLFGGFAPAILTWFTHRSGASAMAPAWYVMSAAVLTLLMLPLFHRRRSAQSALGTASDAAQQPV